MIGIGKIYKSALYQLKNPRINFCFADLLFKLPIIINCWMMKNRNARRYAPMLLLYVFFINCTVCEEVKVKEKTFTFLPDLKPAYSITDQIYAANPAKIEAKPKDFFVQKESAPIKQSKPKQAPKENKKTVEPKKTQIPSAAVQSIEFEDSHQIQFKAFKKYDLKNIDDSSVLKSKNKNDLTRTQIPQEVAAVEAPKKQQIEEPKQTQIPIPNNLKTESSPPAEDNSNENDKNSSSYKLRKQKLIKIVFSTMLLISALVIAFGSKYERKQKKGYVPTNIEDQ